MNFETKTCQNCKNQFTVEPDDFSFYEKMRVPAPMLCPECRFKRRAAFRNERTLYKQKCQLCGRSVITMYHPDSGVTVYCNDCWASDKWDPRSYAKDYDPAHPFFDQLRELFFTVPQSATYASSSMGPNINSEYTNFAGANKDCYLVFNSGPNNENCAYSRGMINCRDTFDTYAADEVERAYEGVSIHKCASVAWCENSLDCLDSWFLINCVGCTNCFGCVNLRHQSYCFLNEQLSKEEWKKRVSEIAGSYSKLQDFKKKFEAFSLKFPRRENHNLKTTNCTGDYIFESKNCLGCFEVSFSEDAKHLFSVKLGKGCYDLIGHGRQSELLLEGVGVGISSRVIGSWFVENAQDIEYSFATLKSKDCFGCVSIKNGKHLILNKQYSEEEYKALRASIIEELKSKDLYGIFMPPELSPFGYNETVGQDNVPMSKEEAIAQGFRWQDNILKTKGQETLAPEQIPDHIKDVQDSILKEILRCVKCGYNYRLIPAELAIYQKALIPVPRECFNCRYDDRIRRRGPMKIYDRTCSRCGKEIKTGYAPDRPEIVYCEACYQKEVV